MTTFKPLSWAATERQPGARLWRRAAAAALRGASALLSRLAERVAAPAPVARDTLRGTLEFYADASAPEGALYADGELVGRLPGVRRL